jgi:hypothetical protein
MGDSSLPAIPEHQFLQIEFNIDQPFYGITAYLATMANGNPNVNRVLATASSVLNDDGALSPRNALTSNDSDPTCSDAPYQECFHSKEEKPCQWLCYDFGEIRVRPTAYSFRTEFMMNAWAVEGSLDGVNWNELDRRKTAPHAFKRETGLRTSGGNEVYRYIRFRQLDKNAKGTHRLSLFRFELFGDISLTSSGIIGRLAKKYEGQNVSHYEPKNVLNFDSDTRFTSRNEPGQWLAIEFTQTTVRLTHSAIRSHRTEVDWNHLKAWILDVSIDGRKGVEVERKVENNQLNGPWFIAAWPILVPHDVRCIRLTLTDKNHNAGNPDWCHVLELSAFELYGTIRQL